MWYKFSAWNQETLYGYTDYPRVAQAALDCLNHNREINMYSVEEVNEVTVPTGNQECPWFGVDTAAEDFEADEPHLEKDLDPCPETCAICQELISYKGEGLRVRGQYFHKRCVSSEVLG